MSSVVRKGRLGTFSAQGARGLGTGNTVDRIAKATEESAAHLRRMRARYAARQAALRAALKAEFGSDVALSGGEAGLHLAMWLPDACSDQRVAHAAAALGLGVRALSSYTRPPMRCNGLVLGYGNLAEGMLDEAVRRLADAVRTATAQPTDAR